MELVQISKTIVEEKYKASDGKIFDFKSHCEEYEDDLEFKNFSFDEAILSTKLSLENYKHFIYSFLHKVYANPLAHKSDMKKKFDTITSLKEYFIKIF